jgi:citrate lyase gamma subunit
MFIFLDESGDLGFDPNKNNSRHFTITLLVCEDKQVQDQIKKAVKRTLKNKINHKAKKRIVEEIKGTGTSLEVKKYFYQRMPEKGWNIYSITVIKANVYQNLSTAQGKKKLYNYLTKKIIENIPSTEDSNSINLVVDKCKNKSEQADFDQYIKSQLQQQFGLTTNISIYHEISKNDCCLQAVDLFCWGLQRKAEQQDCEWLNCFQDKVKVNLLYFGE